MAKIDRYDGNVEAFASQADSNRRTTFGTTTIGDDTLDGNFTQEFFTGWQIVGPNDQPTLEDFNAAFFTISRVQAYLHQVGVPEWNGVQEYHSGSMVNRGGIMYVCLTNSHTNTTPPENDSTNWRLHRAEDVQYDNAASGLTAETAQTAIDELDTDVNSLSSDVSTLNTDVLDVFGQQSLSSNGYQRFPNGLIIQWGSGGGESVTFPIQFPNNAFSVSAIADQGTSGATRAAVMQVQTGSLSSTGVSFLRYLFNTDQSTYTTGTFNYDWIAIGH